VTRWNYVSLTWLAGHTKRIEFGSMVSPVSFRHPNMTARCMAKRGGRPSAPPDAGFRAGWNEREHKKIIGNCSTWNERFYPV